MSFVSYAQNFEDVMLWRALQSVEQGNYIDIGAQDPVVDSVSLAFHERGWHGLHVEPNAEYAAQLKQARPGDGVRQVAVGRASGSISLYQIEGTGLSTGSAEIAQQHREKGFEAQQVEVPLVTLDQLLDERADQPIHWLKIDVEGMEADIIAGWQHSAVRPWIVLLESCQPTSQAQSHEEWEPQLLSKGYRFVYFDGVNRFYLSDRHPELAAAFNAPPNVFDEFTLSGQASHSFCLHMRHQLWQAQVHADELQSQLAHARWQVTDVQAQLADAQWQRDDVQAQLADSQAALNAANQHARQADEMLKKMYRSSSWRLTAPLRAVVQPLYLLREQGARHYLGNLGRRWVVRMASYPSLRRLASAGLRHTPQLETRLRALLSGPPVPVQRPMLSHDEARLTARARRLRGRLTNPAGKESRA